MSDDLVVTLEYRSADRGAIQNWRGPGWYVHAFTTDDHGTFALDPRRIDPVAAVEIAAAFGPPVANLARRQQDEARRQLRARVARLHAVQTELADAEADLARYDEEADESS